MELSALFIRNTDGTINLQDTVTNCAKAVQAQIDKEQSQSEGIGTNVHAVFDQYQGQALPMPSVVNAVFSAMNLPLSEYAETNAAIAEWIRNSPEFLVAKGKGGGVKRICDIIAKK